MRLGELSEAIEAQLVARNPRRMAELRPALQAGYCLRAAEVLFTAERAIIGTGFPVESTFETDGPLGAIALHNALRTLGKACFLACADPLASVLSPDFEVLRLAAFDLEAGQAEARATLSAVAPDVIVSIERPGLAADDRYYNMRGEDISARCAVFDYYLRLADCPTLAIGDGGNEIGMGKLQDAVSRLDIRGSATGCDELLLADVSNWGAYALVAMLEALSGKPLLGAIRHHDTLVYLSERGSIDGVTRENTLTEDGLAESVGLDLIRELETLLAAYTSAQE